MIIFTCITKADEDAAVIWASSLSNALASGKGGVRTFMFHTPDVNTSRFMDFHVNCISVGVPNTIERDEMYIHVLDMMIERSFGDIVMYSTVDMLWRSDVDELANCPLTDSVWLAARNEYVAYDSKRNQKFYENYDAKFISRKLIGTLGYFCDDVMLIKLSGLQKAIKRGRSETLVEYYAMAKDIRQHSPQDAMNCLIDEYVNLFDRYNCFAEEYFDLDFGEMLQRRGEIRNSKAINFRNDNKPWRDTQDFDLPMLSGSQYPFDLYLEACENVLTYITKDFLIKVRENARRYRMVKDWDKEVLAVAGPLKARLEQFRKDLG
jgi:hypothetical protein